MEHSQMEAQKLVGREETLSETEPNTQASREDLCLFTTKTCPNCRIAKSELDRAGLHYRVVDAGEHPDLVRRYQIQQAPTLIVAGETIQKLVGASAIKRFAQGAK